MTDEKQATSKPEEATTDKPEETKPAAEVESKPKAEEDTSTPANPESTEGKEEKTPTKEDTTSEQVEVEEPEVQTKDLPELKPGYTVRVHIRIREGKKERIQVFEGIILKMSGATPETKTITVRKVSKGYGVEKIFPLQMPDLEKIEVVKIAEVTKSKLYYLRKYTKRLKEKIVKK